MPVCIRSRVGRGMRYLGETVADGPLAREQAEEACRRLLGQVRRGQRLHSHATVDDLLNRHLAMLRGSEHTRQSHTLMAAKHLSPFIGHLPLRSVTPEKLEHLYAELLRCREHCPPRSEAGHRCRPLHPATARKLHYLLSAAFRRAVRRDWIDHSPTPDVELHNFAAGLQRDLPAVIAGLTRPWNSGAVEGHVNRIKMLKRQMFGRAGFHLLRKRTLLA